MKKNGFEQLNPMAKNTTSQKKPPPGPNPDAEKRASEIKQKKALAK